MGRQKVLRRGGREVILKGHLKVSFCGCSWCGYCSEYKLPEPEVPSFLLILPWIIVFFPILLSQARHSRKKISQKSTYYSLSREELRVLAKMGPQLLTGCSVLALQSDDTLERAACHPHRFWHQYFVFKETPFPLTQALDLVRLTLLLSRTGQMIRPGEWTYSIVLDTTIGSGWAHRPSQIVENDIQVICCSLRERDCSPFTEFVELGLQLQPQGGIFDTPSREIV